MQKDLLRYTQELDGYQVVAWKVLVDHCAVIDDMTTLQRLAVRRNAKATFNVWIERTAPHRCPECGCAGVSVCEGRERIVRGLPFGNIPTVIHVTSRRMYGPDCGKRPKEDFRFLSHGKSRVTKQLEETIAALRGEMSISAISGYCDLDWNTVKSIEKRRLAAKYAHVPPSRVSAIGIDEIQASRAPVEVGSTSRPSATSERATSCTSPTARVPPCWPTSARRCTGGDGG